MRSARRGSHGVYKSRSAYVVSTPARLDTKAPETSLEDELKEGKVEELTGGAKQEKSGEEEEEEDLDEDSMEWELRNTDSVFSELSELSQDFVDSVDQGASIRGRY